MISLEKIKELVNKSKDLPNSVIEYNGELPNEVEENNFFGIKAVFNKNVIKDTCNLIYKY